MTAPLQGAPAVSVAGRERSIPELIAEADDLLADDSICGGHRHLVESCRRILEALEGGEP